MYVNKFEIHGVSFIQQACSFCVVMLCSMRAIKGYSPGLGPYSRR